jgi:hypothetical protein
MLWRASRKPANPHSSSRPSTRSPRAHACR